MRSLYKIYLSIFVGIFSFPAFAIDTMFLLPQQETEGKIKYQEKRKLCIFPFRNETEEHRLDYLMNGIPSVFKSSFATFLFIYEKEPRIEKIWHPSGKKEVYKKIKETQSPIDPHYISLDVRFYDHEKITEIGYILGRKNKCDYTLTGSFRKNGEDRLDVHLDMLELFYGRKKEVIKNVSLIRAFQELESADHEIKSFLTNGVTLATLKLDATETGTLVFIDELYIGKTPLERHDIPEGKHEIKLVKDGFHTIIETVTLHPGNNSISMTLKRPDKKGRISVSTDPDDADVFLGKEHLGTTPLKDIPVAVGMNRLRISREGFVDYISGVNITADKKTEIEVPLKEGETVNYYKNRGYVYQDYTYYNFSVYSFYSVLLFYAGYMYYNLQADRIIDSLGPSLTYTTPLLTYNNLIASGQSLTPFYYTVFLEEIQVKHAKRKAAIARNKANISLAGGGVMLILGFVFLFMGLDKESLDIGMTIDPVNRETRSFAGYTFSF